VHVRLPYDDTVFGAALQAAAACEVSSDVSASDISFGAMCMRVPRNDTVFDAALQAAVAREVGSVRVYKLRSHNIFVQFVLQC
jgi:hypothetical protein